MAISCFTGKPGNGKTLTMMHFLSEDLLRTERHIVTNIPIKIDELAEYIEREAVRRRLRVPKLHYRLTQIDTVEGLYFWRYRSGGLILPKWEGKAPDGKVLPEEQLLQQSAEYFKRIAEKPEYSQPVSYYISEAHRYYNAKRFQRIAVIAELYVTHHRHLHDEVYFDTQFPKQLAVSLRELTEEWHVLRNDYHRNIGFVKMVPRIRMASFYEMPSGSQNKPFQKRSVFIQENGVAGCYESTGALGTIERASATEQKKVKKGIDIRAFIALVCLGVVGLFAILSFAPQAVFAIAFQSDDNEQGEKFLTPSATETVQTTQPESISVRQSKQPLSQENLYLVKFGFYTYQGKLNFRGTLSDGRTITHDTPGFEGFNSRTHQVRYDGQILDMRREEYQPQPIYANENKVSQSSVDKRSIFKF